MRRVVETDEAGRLTLPPELLREMLGETHPHARYIVEVDGTKVFVTSEKAAGAAGVEGEQPQTHDQWMQNWRELGEEIGKAWPAGVSAVDAVSETRR